MNVYSRFLKVICVAILVIGNELVTSNVITGEQFRRFRRISRKRKGLINLWTSLRLFRQLRYDNATWFADGKQKGSDFSVALPRMHHEGSAS